MSLTKRQKTERFQIDFSNSPSMTEQHHADSCDIHHIMQRVKKTGLLDHTNQYQGTYSDMAGAPDFYEAQVIIAESQSMFETVPSNIRKDFGNDPAAFLNFMQNPENAKKIEAYGLTTSHLPAQEAPPATPPANPSPTPTPPANPSPTPTPEPSSV